MRVIVIKVSLRADWSHSLKEKRMIVRSITQKLKNTFNISVAEVEEQNKHQLIVIGVAGIGANMSQIDSIVENIISFIEVNTDAEIINIEQEVLN